MNDKCDEKRLFFFYFKKKLLIHMECHDTFAPEWKKKNIFFHFTYAMQWMTAESRQSKLWKKGESS